MAESSRERLRALVAAEPTLYQAQLAERLGITAERVRQLLKGEGLTVPRGIRRPTILATTATPEARSVRVPAAAGTIAGHIAELLAAADLAGRGFAVFLPIIRTESCDLLVLHRTSGAVERIEVRSGGRRNGRVYWRKADTSKSDRRAIVIAGEAVAYSPPFE